MIAKSGSGEVIIMEMKKKIKMSKRTMKRVSSQFLFELLNVTI